MPKSTPKSTSASKPATATRSRGRPAKLSREQILNCALKMMQRQPGRKITMTGVAKALNTAPMSLYTHVKHRDDLMDGLSDVVLGQLQLDINASDPWQKQVRDWMEALHTHLSQYPQTVEILSQSKRIPTAWLRVHAVLIHSLKRAGLKGKNLAGASQWLAQQVVGSLLVGFASHERGNTEQDMAEGLKTLSAEDQKLYGEMLPHIQPDMAVFTFTVDRAIAAMERLLD